MHVSLCRIAHDSLVVLAGSGVGFDVDAESAVELEFQSGVQVSIYIYLRMEKQNLHCRILTRPRFNTAFNTLILQLPSYTP